MKHRGWIICSGLIWVLIGTWLLYKGLRLTSTPWIIACGLLIGFLKGRFVFPKTVQRVVGRIEALSLPIRFSQVYTPAYWMLIAGMMSLGMLFRFLPVPVDVRGLVDIAIGSALVNGATLYFRAARVFVSN